MKESLPQYKVKIGLRYGSVEYLLSIDEDLGSVLGLAKDKQKMELHALL